MENQISQLDRVVSSPHNSNSHLLAPNESLLSVLKTVGAKGSWTPAGRELFSIHQLFEFLVAYIKKNLLYDPMNPLIVYCKSDPLGEVFGVEKFTKQDALSLLMQNCMDVVSSPKVQQKIGAVPISVHSLLISGDSAHVSNIAPSISTGMPHFTIPRLQTHSPSHTLKRHASPGPGYPDSKRLKHDESNCSSPSAGSGECRRTRTRQPSLSIVYSDGDTGNGDYDWRLTFTALRVADTDTESVYSVQSKETTLARDSSDDYWFVEENDEDDGDEIDGISVQMGNDGFSLEFTGEEYEVVSEQSASEYDSDGSESPQEEIFVVYQSDEEFWADSESSDTECETFSADEEISDGDKWTCITCGEVNYPLRRHCDRCWALRSSWLPLKRTNKTQYYQDREKKIENCSDITCGLDKKEQEINSGHLLKRGHRDDNKIDAQSLREIGSGDILEKDAICEAQTSDTISKEDVTRQHDTFPPNLSMTCVDDVEKSDISQTGEPSLSGPDSTCKPPLKRCDTIPVSELTLNPLLKETSPELPAKRRRMLSINDSGLGLSIHSVTTPTFHEFDSGISSQEMPKERDIAIVDGERNTETTTFDCFSALSPSAASPAKSLYQHQTPQSSTSDKSPIKDKRYFKENIVAKRRQRVSFSSSSDEKGGSSSPSFTDQAATDSCMICLSKPKEASIIHGKTGHQVCCYVCAKRLKKKGKSCPVCRRPITKVIKNYLV